MTNTTDAAAADRTDLATAFLARAGWAGADRRLLAGDASNRRYDRLTHPRLGPAVLMDADPAKGEDVRPFAALAQLLCDRGFSAPAVFAADAEAGFLLLEDLGDALFSRVAAAEPEAEQALYAGAIDALLALHDPSPPVFSPILAPALRADAAAPAYPIPPYDAATLRREAALATDWWLPGVTGAPTPPTVRETFLALIDAACAEIAVDRQALVLRDFHADNLIWLPQRAGVARIGLLDFQDALIGHPAYDLASVLEDARRDVSPDLAAAMIDRYLNGRPALDRELFLADYAVLAAQRNLKIIGIFARLSMRDGKNGYLDLIPRVWRHLQSDLRHPKLAALKDWSDTHLPEPTAHALARIRDGAAP